MSPTVAGPERKPCECPLSEYPSVILARGLLEPIYQYICNFQQERGTGIEIGGMLTGQFVRQEGWPVFKVNGFIGAGPNADCTEESVLFDTEYQSRALEAMRVREPRTGNMGCIHLHPDCLDVCSEGDLLADIEAVKASDTKALVFSIVTINNPRPDPLSLFHRNFKFDFYVLSEELGFEYRHVRPVFADRIVLAGPPAQGGVPPAQFRRHCAWRPRLLKDKKRLVAEVRAMEERYGGRATLHLDGNLLYWRYTVVESGRRFPIQVRYPRRYPFEPPQIFSELPLPGSPHQMPGNELCWTNRLASSEWNPARDTAATCIHAAHRWFACLLVYLTLHKWPAEADDELR
ncbi:MAG TPA: hypothetical protein VMU04_08515 [Candidatus Acidoferrum sp.]|nr:hypothetical protein [Candidatus Acidoferrum sp.]